MGTIDRPYFYTVYSKKPSPSSPAFKAIGAYSDIRDAMQAIVTAYRLNPSLTYCLESSVNKPLHWVHKSKYLT
jgi:hypothetical protein